MALTMLPASEAPKTTTTISTATATSAAAAAATVAGGHATCMVCR